MNSQTRLIIVGLVLATAIFALLPTYQAYQLDQERQELAEKARTDSSYAEQLRVWDSVHGLNYRDEAANFLAGPIKLGLDLQGGIYITMEVDAPALLQESAVRLAIDETFERVLAETREETLTSDEPVIDIFTAKFNEIARPQGKTLLDYYDLGDLGADASDERILEKLRDNIDDAVNQAVEVVRRRIDKFGVTEPSIQKQGGRRIVLELPGVTNEEQIRDLLQTTARLEFKLVKHTPEVLKAFKRIDEVLAKTSTPEEAATGETTDTTASTPEQTADNDTTSGNTGDTTGTQTAGNDTDTSGGAGNDTNVTTAGADTTADTTGQLSEEEAARKYQSEHPFTTLFMTYYQQSRDQQMQDVTGIYGNNTFPSEGYFSFFIPKANMAKVQEILDRQEIRAIFPDDLIVAFDARPVGGEEVEPENAAFWMWVLKRDAELTGEYVTDALQNIDQRTGSPVVYMYMNGEGADIWANVTGENVNKRVAIVLDSAVYSAPNVENKITGGVSTITGQQDIEEATLLAVVLKAGALKAPVKIIEERIVGPSLGEDSIRKGVNATLIAAGIVILFMALYYAFGGLIADLAVIMNVAITLAVLAALQGTLTLPGIGALVLTIGMAVDANILIYERIREEMANGRSLKLAVDLGYEKAFSAIIDSNITTFITGGILFLVGTGPIQGFAVMLMIGILSTLFTAMFVTRTVFMVMLERGATSISFGQPKTAGAAHPSAATS